MPPAVFLHPGWIWCLYWRGKEAQGACFMEGEAAAGCWVCSQWLWGPESSLRQFSRWELCCSWWHSYSSRAAAPAAGVRKESVTMRIVVWKSPKALSGILRKLFRISE